MNRREFIASSVAGMATLGVPALAVEGRIKVGFLGATHSHALGKYRAVQANNNFQLVGICESNEAARRRFAALSPEYVDEATLLANSDLVVVESAVRTLAKNGLTALRAGKHVHVEKPPSARLSELEEMIRIAREKRLVFQTGYMWRFNPGVEKIFEAVRQGWLGEIHLVRATMNTLVRDAGTRAEWAEFKGGAMFELGSHVIDFVVRLMGKPLKIHSFLRTHGADDKLADNNVAVLEYPKAQAVITNNSLQPNPFVHRHLEVSGSNGTALLKPIEPPTLEIDLAQAAGPYMAGKNRPSLPLYERYHGDFAELAKILRRNAQPLATLEDELKVHETLLKICGMEE